MIMWEILFGLPITKIYDVFLKYFGPDLAVQIVFNDLRPPIFENIESCYVNLMKKCWESDPKKRPSAAEICESFAKWQNYDEILSELIECDKKMLRLMSNTHKALNTINHKSDFAELLDDKKISDSMNNLIYTIYHKSELLDDKKISDLMSNLIDNKLDYPDEFIMIS
ncbi:hypothetical protein C2G38_2055801 [Gigaspora rosea]|uniref:Serine-threonine/tyrosine-protein kinase catalytic domain-containing protein n=1 Tax=Gigaspora rosea TaxID=44941 RepID=A0A397W4W0_9GLOM|nr:hypothetical protein C2G38_2055801 [Gigaspora rosea]